MCFAWSSIGVFIFLYFCWSFFSFFLFVFRLLEIGAGDEGDKEGVYGGEVLRLKTLMFLNTFLDLWIKNYDR